MLFLNFSFFYIPHLFARYVSTEIASFLTQLAPEYMIVLESAVSYKFVI